MSRDQHTPMPDSSLVEIAEGIQEDPKLDQDADAFLEAALAADTVPPPSIDEMPTYPPLDSIDEETTNPNLR